jgi:hypothetical protein
MNTAVNTAQSAINSCCSSGNIAVVLSNDIANLRNLLNNIDPTKIDFSNLGFMNKRKITKYWGTFEEAYPRIIELINSLTKGEKILNNTIKTLTIVNKSFATEYENFIANGDDTDVEFVQQEAVSSNMSAMLKNSLTEYETLLSKVQLVLNVLVQTMDTAILFARTTYKQEFVNTVAKRGLSGSGNEADFKSSMSHLIKCLT